MGNLSNSVGFSLPLAIGMDTIRIARVDTGNIGIARVDTGNMGIARVDTRDMGDSGVCEGNSTNCFDTSLNSIGDHANIVSTTISQCIQDWQTSSNLSNSVGLGIPRDSSNGQTDNESSHGAGCCYKVRPITED